MIVTTNEHGDFVLKDVFNPIILETEEGEIISIAMRDGGYEIAYDGKLHSVRDGAIKVIEEIIEIPIDHPKAEVYFASMAEVQVWIAKAAEFMRWYNKCDQREAVRTVKEMLVFDIKNDWYNEIRWTLDDLINKSNGELATQLETFIEERIDSMNPGLSKKKKRKGGSFFSG